MPLIARLAELAKGHYGLRLEIQTKDDRVTLALIPKVTGVTESDLNHPTRGPLLRCLTRPIAVAVATAELDSADALLEAALASLPAERASLESALERYRDEAAVAKKSAEEAARTRAAGRPGATKATREPSAPKRASGETEPEALPTDATGETSSGAPAFVGDSSSAADSGEPGLFD
jgi:hypothetical protein